MAWRFRSEPGFGSRSGSGSEVSVCSWRMDDIHRSPHRNRRTTACSFWHEGIFVLFFHHGGAEAEMCVALPCSCVLSINSACVCSHACAALIGRVCANRTSAKSKSLSGNNWRSQQALVRRRRCCDRQQPRRGSSRTVNDPEFSVNRA